jgi:hypothetical protein
MLEKVCYSSDEIYSKSSSSSLHLLGESPVPASSVVSLIFFLVYLCHIFRMVDLPNLLSYLNNSGGGGVKFTKHFRGGERYTIFGTSGLEEGRGSGPIRGEELGGGFVACVAQRRQHVAKCLTDFHLI